VPVTAPDAIGRFSRIPLVQLFRVTPTGVLVAERLVERVGLCSAVRRVEHHRLAATVARLFLERLHQQLADAAAAESLADDEAGNLDAGLVALDEVLDVESSESCDLSVQLCDDEPGRGVARDALDPLGCLLRRRWVPKLAQEHRDGRRVLGSSGAELRL
jgi:hypothetical protein